MPVSTRQATPGPSNSNSTTSQLLNTKKRAGSEGHESVRDSKKMRLDSESLSQISAVSAKDKKKKKKKKKKKVSVVHSDLEIKIPTRAKSGSVTLSPTKSRATVLSVHSIEEDNHTDEEAEEAAIMSSSDKGKGKAKSPPESPPQRDADAESHAIQPIASGSDLSHVDSAEYTSQALEIALLKEQLAAQTKLLERHQTHVGHQQQSLTCQICLDLMYKPYALSPCGHITCYGCLVRWFTAPQNPELPPLVNGNAAIQEPDSIEAILSSATARNGSYIRRRKKCPVCRAVVVERPVEMWGIKDMVSALVRSKLIDIPPPPAPTPPAAEEGANADPWRNVFRRAGSMGINPFEAAFFRFAGPAEPREQDDGDREQMGWFDAEDGGIHRCIDCYHEIWDGVCSACHRAYPGHGRHLDDDDDDEDDEEEADWYMRRFRREMEANTDDSEEEDDAGFFPILTSREAREHLEAFRHHLEHAGQLSEEDADEDEDEHGGGFDERSLEVALFETVDEDDDDEDEGDSEYGGSFIDDDDVVQVVPSRHRASISRRRITEVVSSDDEDEEDGYVAGAIDLDDEEDGDDMIIHSRIVRRRPRAIVGDESDSGQETEGDDDDHEDHSGGNFRSAALRRLYEDVSSLEEDDEDGEEVSMLDRAAALFADWTGSEEDNASDGSSDE